MATTELHVRISSTHSTNGEPGFTICTFCNNSTNGFEKRLFATTQPKGPFFPVLAELQGKKTKLDDLGRAVVCVACFHHLLRQWSSFERRGIPVRKREYNIVTEERVNHYQVRREEEIRKEAEHKIKEIQDREERIRREAEDRLEKYRQRQAEIRQEAEQRLLEEQAKVEEFKKQATSQLKEEQQREEELRRQAEDRIQEEKEKREYIRQEAERLLREEKLLDAHRPKQGSISPSLDKVTTYRTEVIIPSTVKETVPLREVTDKGEPEEMAGVISEKELDARRQRRKMMEYDPETGCYRKTAPDDDKENTKVETKMERVEYSFRLSLDENAKKTMEKKDTSSKPDKASEDITVSMEPERSYSTEQTIVLNGDDKSKRKSCEGDTKGEEDLKKAGDIMKARFEEGRKIFEHESVERKRSDPSRQRTTRTTSDDSLEEKIREMEKRRERLLLRGPSTESKDTLVRKPPEEGKDSSAVSPREGSEGPVDDSTKKQRSRSERNKRRLTAEEMTFKKSSPGGEEDSTGVDAAKVLKTDVKNEERQIETKKESYKIQFKKVEKPERQVEEDDIVMTQVKKVETSVDLMSWDDSTDGPTYGTEQDSSPVGQTELRKMADSTEAELFPRPSKLVDTGELISVVKKGEVETALHSKNLLDLDEASDVSSAPIEPISTWDNRSRTSNSAEEDRRRREREYEERKRRIEENQRRAAKELEAKKPYENDVKPWSEEQIQEEKHDHDISIKEKRRSLLDMWESFSEPHTNVMSFEEYEDEKLPEEMNNVVTLEKKAVSFDPLGEKKDEADMEVEVITTTPTPVDTNINPNLTEDEQRWESAGQFQPGRLQKTMFHSLSEAAPVEETPTPKPRKSRYDWMKGETEDDQAALVPTKLKIDRQGNELEDGKLSTDQDRASPPQPVPRKVKTESYDLKSSSESESESDKGRESDSESESEEERVPRVDTVEVHNTLLTEEEKQWEQTGNFQPKKLNLSLFAGFQQTPASAEERPSPKKTQGASQPSQNKKPLVNYEEEIPSPTEVKVQETEPEIEDISPVREVKTETEPFSSSLYTYVYEEESDDNDDIPGWRKVEEQRRQQEREEIERAKLEEKRRRERETMEEESHQQPDSSDDEFESKVRTKEVRKIDPNLLFQFMKEADKESERPLKSVKPKEQQIDLSSIVSLSESTPVNDSPFEDRPVGDQEREVKDEYEEKVRSGQIRKLKLANSPFLQSKETDNAPDYSRNESSGARIIQDEIYVEKVEHSTVESAPRRDWEEEEDEPDVGNFGRATLESYEEESEDNGIPEWRKVEEKRKQQEQKEIERARSEEQRRQEREALESIEQEDEDSIDDEFEAKVRTKEIRRINPSLLVQFMNEKKEENASTGRPKKEIVKSQHVLVTETTSKDDSDLEDAKEKEDEFVEDEYDLKVKKGQVNKLVLDNSPFLQRQIRDETPVFKTKSEHKPSKVLKQTSQDSFVQEEEFVQVIDEEVVESSPDMGFLEENGHDEYEVKVKSKLVKRLSQDQFSFLRKQEEEERKRLQEEERRRIEREERELLKKEEERRKRLQAEARAREEERVRKEEEIRRQEEEVRARKEEETRRRREEAERVRKDEEERLRREEEEEQMRMEEMRRQKEAAKRKFQTGIFDDVPITRSEKDICSVGRLDANKFLQFQQNPMEEPKLKSKPRFEQKGTNEHKVPEADVQTVQVASVDLIESSPYEEDRGSLLSEDADYEEKRKSVGKLDKDWYIIQQRKQAEENERRAKELEEQRLREERNEMLRFQDDDSTAEVVGTLEKRRSKLSADKFSVFEQDAAGGHSRPRKTQKEVSIVVEKKEEVQSAATEIQECEINEEIRTKNYDDGSVIILGMDDSETARRKMRLQRERDEKELLRQEEERRRLLAEESLDFRASEAVTDKPQSVGKLNYEQFSAFQQEGSATPKVKPRKQDPQVIQEVVNVKSQEVVESFPVDMNEAFVYRGGPAETQEDVEYEKKINAVQKLDVDKFLNARSQESVERTQRAKRMADERMRQEQEELAKLRLEEQRRMQAEVDAGYDREKESDLIQTLETASRKTISDSDSERSRKVSIERKPSKLKEHQPESTDKGVGVGRLPEELRLQFESDSQNSSSRRQSSKIKGPRSLTDEESTRTNSIESLRSISGESLSSGPREKDMNGTAGTFEKLSSLDRRESSQETPVEDKTIESYSPEEKPIPKKLNTSMFAAFKKSDSEPVQLRRAKSEKRARPKSIGNVDLLIWQDDSNLSQPPSSVSRGTSGRQPRPKSIAF